MRMCDVRKILPVIFLMCFVGINVSSLEPKEVQGPFFFKGGKEVSQEGKEHT